MKSLIIKVARTFLIRFIGVKNIERIILILARLARIDLLTLSYYNLGILKYWDSKVSGEDFVIDNVLNKYLQKEKLILFDVGANVGNYSRKLRLKFPNAQIYAFEPNPNTFEILISNLTSISVSCQNLGLSSKPSKQKIYTYADQLSSEHASIYREVLKDLHKASDIVELEFFNSTLDEFCKNNNIDHIDFIKIDTEGHELDVLTGGLKMISENRVSLIQFEFNEMNIISRIFLKDFYDILSEYSIYRLDSNKLIPLLEYSSTNEIFKFQNLLAVNKNHNYKNN